MQCLIFTIEEAKLTAQQEAKKIIINNSKSWYRRSSRKLYLFSTLNLMLKVELLVVKEETLERLEAATVEIIVDDTPEAISFSCFDPVQKLLV
jgi:ribonuclease Y